MPYLFDCKNLTRNLKYSVSLYIILSASVRKQKKRKIQKRSFENSSGSSRLFLFYLWKKNKKNKTSSLLFANIINSLIKTNFYHAFLIYLTILGQICRIVLHKYGMICSFPVFMSATFPIPCYQERTCYQACYADNPQINVVLALVLLNNPCLIPVVFYQRTYLFLL